MGNILSTEKLEIGPPFTIEFDITRTFFNSANTAQIKVYNLGADLRQKLRLDFGNFNNVIQIELYAGYGEENYLPLVFSGNITWAYSMREGTDFVSTFESFDGGFSFRKLISGGKVTYAAGTLLESVYRSLMSDLPNVTYGKISDVFLRDKNGNAATLSRPYSVNGTVVDALNELSNNHFFTDNGIGYILESRDAISEDMYLITADSGLIGTPIREQNTVTLEMIFEPKLQVHQLLLIDSSTNTWFNNYQNVGYDDLVKGTYTVKSVKHRGMISDTIAGDLKTTVTFMYHFAGNKIKDGPNKVEG